MKNVLQGTDLLIDMQKSCDTMQIEIFLEKMQVVCISINTSYVSILSLHKTWDSLEVLTVEAGETALHSGK